MNLVEHMFYLKQRYTEKKKSPHSRALPINKFSIKINLTFSWAYYKIVKFLFLDLHCH